MDVEEFRTNGKDMIDYICDYMKNIDKRDVAPTVDPGFLKNMIPGMLVFIKEFDLLALSFLKLRLIYLSL